MSKVLTDQIEKRTGGTAMDVPTSGKWPTANIADDAITLAKQAAGTQGGTIYYGAAGAPTELAAGTSGQFLKTQGSAANPVWGSVTEYNDAAVLNDIATLALQQATQNNQSAYNLANAFVDQYEDSTGIDVLTNVTRDSGEFMASVGSGTQSSVIAFPDSGNLSITSSDILPSSNTNWTVEGWMYTTDGSNTDQALWSNGTNFYGVNSNIVSNSASNVRTWVGNGSSWAYDVNEQTWANAGVAVNTWIHHAVTKSGTTYTLFWGGTTQQNGTATVSDSGTTYLIGKHMATSNYMDGYMTGIRVSSVNRYTSGNFTPVTTPFATDGDTEFLLNSNTTNGSTTFTDSSSNSITISVGGSGITHSTAVTSPLSTPYSNATGNYTSTTETAAATVSKMSIVVLYKNAYGTATLDTDLVAQVSANGGTNYTSAPLTAMGTFSTGILMAKSNDITISNTGTAPKYKISFANQAAASKETRVYGVALLY